jgi:hypothetical protein
VSTVLTLEEENARAHQQHLEWLAELESAGVLGDPEAEANWLDQIEAEQDQREPAA